MTLWVLRALLSVVLCNGVTRDPTDTRPNVLFVVVDDMGWEDLRELPLTQIHGALGAARVYPRFYTSPVCSPSRYQMMYGRYAHDALIGKAIDTSNAAEKGAPTEHLCVAESMSAADYRTALFGKWHVSGPATGALGESARVHGFERWRAGVPDNLPNIAGAHYDWRRFDDGKQTTEFAYTSIAIEEALRAWWTTTAGPKFAVCSFIAPHQPFDLAPSELLGGFTPANNDRGRFESAVVAIDTLFGAILTYVDTRDTYIFLLADNGTPHQVPPPTPAFSGYKTTVYEGGINVPLLVWGPDVLPGEDPSLAQICDLPRTVLDLTGTSARREYQASISLAPNLRYGTPGERPWVFVQRFVPNGGTAPQLSLHRWAVVRADGWKLARHNSFELVLSDLNADPFEKAPDATQAQPAIAAELLAIFHAALGPNWPY